MSVFDSKFIIDLVTPEITNQCNYSCYSCPHRSLDRAIGNMSVDLFKKIFNDCQKNTKELCIAFFGEPMLHPQFMDILAYMKAKRSSLYLSINTNLSCATREILNALIDVPFNQVRFSVDAATQETYRIVRPAEFALDLEGTRYEGNRLDLIDEKVRWWHSLSNHVSTRHVYTVSSINIDELPLYVEKWVPLFGTMDELRAKRLLTYGGKISDPLLKPHPCNVWGQRFAAIDWQGNVSPCNLDTEMELTIGNINDATLEELFKSKAWEETRSRSILEKESPCRECIDSNAWAEDRNLVLKSGDKWDASYWKRFR
ncbi:radical SAM protein [Geobacter argillaceus]|uniref:Radical SAM protein with 4Fe4S-binding SPASM domain n=1 Tax=Geobacter argillaceus TaxID=345631 RepID=A0A562WS97_9BACT|nr:radical SAM protein [Geobacter argillaceus]TWJ33050.1 radical SAM protein with 4Fe4S-binding SPASM domain [Geobacter argillaceus]